MHNDTFEQGAWSLTDLLSAPSGPQLAQFVDELEDAVAQLETKRDQLTPEIPADSFKEIMIFVERINALISRLGAYSWLWYAGDTQAQEALAFRGRIEKLLTEIRNRTLFFALWWKGLDDGPAGRLLDGSGDNRYYLEALRHLKPHTLSEPEEQVINLKNVNGVEALVTVYEMITNAFTYRNEIDGEIKELNRTELATYAQDPRPEARAAAYQELNRVFTEHGVVLGQIYQHVVRDWASENVTLRRFASPISARNRGNDIPDAVVNTLLDVCRDHAKLFQRYYRLKAGWLDMDKLRRCDIYAPLSASDKRYSYSEAANMVLDSLNAFSPTLANHARRVFDDGHLDSEVRPRKDIGAFCSSPLPGITPWVLVNYNGQASDVATLAHELGHAIHALMAAHHSPLTFRSSLPLAETASVFAEMLLLERMLEQESDPSLRRDILARFIDGAYATVMRQAFFTRFEREAHALIEEGATSDQLAERYLANLHVQFGDAVEVGDEFRWEWVSIPHFYHTPFYCYAYSFGLLLVLALYRQYQTEGEAFKPKYLRILAYGGSRSPSEILTEAGIDMASAAFWQGGFDVIADMIQELEELGSSHSG
jgi:oligoendopeptidase F